MIQLEVELQDWDESYTYKTVTIPSDLRLKLKHSSEYIIVDTTPGILDVQSMDIWMLNEVINDINSANPAMTAELLAMIMDVVDGNLEDEEFVRRIKENDFMFEDISDIAWGMGDTEGAAKYIATELKVPFATGFPKEMLDIIGKDGVAEYINWEEVWSRYEAMGFRTAENIDSEDYTLYLIHWR